MKKLITKFTHNLPILGVAAVVALLAADVAGPAWFGWSPLLGSEPAWFAAVAMLAASCLTPLLRWALTREDDARERFALALLVLVAFTALHPGVAPEDDPIPAMVVKSADQQAPDAIIEHTPEQPTRRG